MQLPFEPEYRKRYYQLLDQVFDSNYWSDGPMTRLFEEKFYEFTGLPSKAVSNAGTGLLAILDYIEVQGAEVVVPSNTFWATTQAVNKAGGVPVFADSNRNDLCLSFDSLVKSVTPKTKAVIVVHIGGHIAFEIEKIAEFCKQKSIYLIEDCAHVHGGTWNGKTGGHWGFAGSYSFYATKTMPLGEGGMVVSHNKSFLDWLDQYRNYGKKVVNGVVTYPLKTGFNYRMSEMTAALGIVQLERMPKILNWKKELAAKYDQIFENRVRFPSGMESGFYKYIVFDYDLKEKTGQVFGPNDLGHKISGTGITLPNAEWITEHHSCPPIYYGWNGSNLKQEDLLKRLISS